MEANKRVLPEIKTTVILSYNKAVVFLFEFYIEINLEKSQILFKICNVKLKNLYSIGVLM